MPRSKRSRRERTHDWQKIQQYTLWPEQKIYELLWAKSVPDSRRPPHFGQ